MRFHSPLPCIFLTAVAKIKQCLIDSIDRKLSLTLETALYREFPVKYAINKPGNIGEGNFI